MLIPKKDRTLISKYLFEEGVMVAKKDYNAAKHPHVPCRNLYVIKLMQSFKSRGYVTETFSWQWYYWYLTNEGIEFLRGLLHLPEEVVPRTLKPKKGNNRVSTGRPQDRFSGNRRGAPGGFKPGQDRFGGGDRWNRDKTPKPTEGAE
mmetsp:Transcript_114192/g.170812  ORF Transcript_114192/g.170812 Transcript_114192/m.170812 type:complete len:147 (-) Transcript_114192:90-530(-)|eukprot:CAMPEP_0117043652 /NCGR_PEP_ID=MMETSP0472-20121206/30327_1 /TAXON_ID=693140 ORGANISM="Tiarina fusus, Strain LIS" /NCGR_SAMPLE_ID=MMETSP0472 /ASSEMBLY_ACC=CAM_ASM_000603 /LENGTH=146 /DNA_ID=CAMNT_0004755225 /DNA_START=27 /DNA_END=467 /DNA_ORIENTATION=-